MCRGDFYFRGHQSEKVNMKHAGDLLLENTEPWFSN